MPDINYEKLYLCCKREVNLRKRVYPKWVEQGKMQHLKAVEEIELMQQAAEHFKNLFEQNNPNINEQKKLF